jgi:7-cyano-7-deazaguanine synthase
MSKAILLSGGIDSVALAYWLRPEIAITLDYGQQPSKAEIRASKVIAKELNITHHIITVDCSSLGSGDLLNKESISAAPSSEWWPYRNQLLITLACMKAITLGVTELMTASVRSDGFHKDGTVEFYKLINDLMVFQEGNIQITSPAIGFSSVELVKKSGIPNSLLYWAHSCHKSNVPCSNCRGCNKYRQTIFELEQHA